MDDNNKPLPDFTPEKDSRMWENLKRDIAIHERRKQIKKFYFKAAILVIFLSVGSILGYNTIFKPDVYLAGSQNFEIKLADGSVVILSQGAKLTVEKSFPTETRDVFLEGDAVFNVTKSKKHPFIVHGKGYETKVLGTVFKVTQSGQTFKVDLFEGKVLVYKKGHSKEPIVLKPQQTFSNYGSPNVASVTKTNEERIPATKDKTATLIFNKCPINDAVKIIEKTYGIKVQYPSELENIKITITVPDAKAVAFIQTLAIQSNLNIKQNNDSTFELEK
ncbi:FecR family protein [Chryseobacterium sp. ISL-6]|uniref:FecR family protein n=1 Tax=Chryseobacterium sp. ISL-6 TaxID=2819143 RepID=UPI001BE71CB0|nr:FecR family protein [Chryseobacterium sp. ISL-6]MBT2621918.1 FecR domain-containing protein [Chryseobacterium sp. ISL-6]